MSRNLNSNNFEKGDCNGNTKDIDYKKLITRLKEMKIKITLLEKTIFK